MRERLKQERKDPNVEFEEFFQHDVRYVGIPLAPRPEGTPEPEWSPLPTAEAIAKCAEKVRELRGRGVAVCGSYACGVFEQAKHWLGDAETLTLAFEDPDRLSRELDRITEWKMAIYGAYAKAGADIVWIGDDLGAQDRLIMSPAHYRQWYRPRHARIVEHLRAIRADVRIAFHCCGHVTPLIPDLIDIGIDVLEAVQPEAMDIRQLKREFGRDLCFWGGIGLQSTLARTTPAQVSEGVRRALSIMAPGGGYIAAPCHTLTEEVPWETAVAFHEAIRQYGNTPQPAPNCPSKRPSVARGR
jgi:uroporphyrinogen decarboxylase